MKKLTFVLLCGIAALLSACSGMNNAAPTVSGTTSVPQLVSSTATATPTTSAVDAGAPGYGPVTGPTTIAMAGSAPTRTPLLPTQPGINVTYGAITDPNYTPPPTMTPLPPTVFAPATSGAATPTFGSLIDPNYTPPPTETAAPTTLATLPPIGEPTITPTAGPVLRSDLMGIQIHGNLSDYDWATALDRAKQLGVKWLKVQVQWREYEPAQGQYTEAYRGLVLNLQRAHLQGFRTLINIAKAPGWARPLTTASQEDGPPSDPATFASFVGHFVSDVKPEFIDAIEIWNEPNLLREWRDKPLSGGEYMALFNAGYEAIQTEQAKQPAPDGHRITVITAGPAPTFSDPNGGSLDDRLWLQQLYDAGLAQYGVDVAVGVHPYGWVNPPESVCCTPSPGVTGWYEEPVFYFRNTLDDYRNIMIRNKDQETRLWITEFGWATYDGLKRSDGSTGTAGPDSGWQSVLTEQQQAEYVLRAFWLVQHAPYYEFTGPMMLWNLNFATLAGFVDQSREEAAFSLLDQAGNPRPVFTALQEAAKQ
ncbi:MAG: hypothetical protein KF726_05805 [Anaerolineae bacterium]|nr:hypothetical protein [Anaerolineae bacterium]